MRLLGIDFGKRKIGLALSQGSLAEPFKVLRYEEDDALRKEIQAVVESEEIERIVVGISEGQSAREARQFGENLKSLGVEVVFSDETLSTISAQNLSREAGIRRKKRKSMEDAFAAAVMLQSYLESNV
jgi:putative Holliday junction resolvase